MRKHQPNRRYLVGAVALCLGAILVGLAYRTHPDKSPDIDISIFVGLAVLSVEILIVYVVVDQLLAARDRKKWQYAYTAIAKILATCFVDLMRLLYLTTTETDHPDRKRLPEFLTMAGDHLGDLRSYIEGFAPILDEDAQTRSRNLEGKLRGLCHLLDSEEKIAGLCRENHLALMYFRDLRVLSGEVFDFLCGLSVEKFRSEWQMIGEICEPILRARDLNLADPP
jgi:hypothetical protein